MRVAQRTGTEVAWRCKAEMAFLLTLVLLALGVHSRAGHSQWKLQDKQLRERTQFENAHCAKH